MRPHGGGTKNTPKDTPLVLIRPVRLDLPDRLTRVKAPPAMRGIREQPSDRLGRRAGRIYRIDKIIWFLVLSANQLPCSAVGCFCIVRLWAIYGK